jgi:hypothetical protein
VVHSTALRTTACDELYSVQLGAAGGTRFDATPLGRARAAGSSSIHQLRSGSQIRQIFMKLDEMRWNRSGPNSEIGEF